MVSNIRYNDGTPIDKRKEQPIMYFKAIITVQILWFCRSEAFVNLAVNGIATQKGVYSSYDASKAIDGNYNQSFNGGSCCHTAVGQLSAWWRLDLRKTAYIHRVVIYYREDQWARLSGYKLYISNSSYPKFYHLCYEDRPRTTYPNVIQNITCGMTGKYVIFFNERHNGKDAFVELCEVEVFGCFIGLYGPRCESKCSVNCHNGICDIWNGSCDSCKSGFGGDQCRQSCPLNYYGENCAKKCGHCKYGGCNQFNGDCNTNICSAGWSGPRCDTACPRNYYGENCAKKCGYCKYGGCNKFNGDCNTNICSAGWSGKRCDTECQDDSYGENCTYHCGNCKYSGCNKINGHCPYTLCLFGWKGLKCDTPCPDGSYGENCGRRCGHCKAFGCNKTNGECINTLCTAGWTGQKCDRECQGNSYGENCAYHCGNCKWPGCDKINGSCSYKRCSIGWKGLKCDIPCPGGSYGENCERRCGHCKAFGCNRTNGKCINTLCTAGWTGQKCDRKCQFNSYGENCAYHCGHCKRLGCDKINGYCANKQCLSGWKGQTCDTPCPEGSYGEDCAKQCGHCKDPGCNKRNGECINASCSAGWKGHKCDRACASGHYGESCARMCGHCKDFSCNRTNGNCLTTSCSAGWKGQKCDIECATNSYGENCAHQCGNCIQSTCDRINGNCADNECSAGWRGQRCDIQCDRGTYGINCSKYCNNCVNESCDHLNGICQISGSCKAGYYGPQCSEVCLSGRFGYNCIDTCSGCLNENCEPFSGNCTQDGCRNGYTGYRCHLRGVASLNNDESKSTIIGGVIGAIMAVIAISLIGIFIFRKRTKGPGTPKKGTHFRNDVKESCNPGYSIETIESPQYAHVEKENQMSLKGLDDYQEDSVELGIISSTNNMYANARRPDDLYQNTELKDIAKTNNAFSEYNIAVGNLPSIAKIKRKNNAFKKEYVMLPKGLNFPHSEGEREENRQKNRYLTTFPYDHSRVKLEMCDNSSDYINANYIKNYSKDKAYIATQGPKKITLIEFWQMIWQENVDIIVMVTKLMEGEKKKCEQYWPESTYKQLVIGKFTLKMLVEKENTVYAYRCIQLSCGNTNRTVHHFHFTKWPDHDVPDKTDLVNFYRKVKSTPTNLSGPMVVHCSAGIGRTGTFLALDALYEDGKTTGFVNIMEYTHMMRQDRMNMIQTVEQYATVYDVLVEAYTVPQSAIPRQDFLNMLDSRLIEREYQILQDFKPEIEANKFQAGKRKENVPKNEVQNILPHDDYRPYLMSYGRSSNDYINAVKIPSFTEGSNIFVTQHPLLNTIGDLWSLVYDNDCRTIFILEEINEDVPVIPSDTDHKISNDNFIISRNLQNVSLQDGVKVSLRHKNKKEERPITVFVYNDWEDNNPIPNSTKTMVDFLEIVSRTTRADHESIVVICRDGCTRSGIFVTLKLVLEKMETDDEVDIFQVSRRIQTRRPQFLSSIEQYEFCYSALKELLSRESVYANA